MYTYIISIRYTTDVQQRCRKPSVGHLKTIVDSPERGGEAIADPREPTTRSSVRLEEHNRQIPCQSQVCGVAVLVDEFHNVGLMLLPR